MTENQGTVPDELLEIMACPSCHGDLRQTFDPPELVCVDCGLHYPVKDGIPVMMLDEAYRPGDGA